MRKVLVSAVALALAACSTAPGRVKPASVDQAPYMVLDCAELAARAQHTGSELERYVSSQHRIRVVDAITFPIPFSRIFGKNRRNVRVIAQLRGELVAIQRSQAELGCTVQAPQSPTAQAR